MKELEVNIIKQGHLDLLTARFPQFSVLRDKTLPLIEKYRWSLGTNIIYCFQIIFLGKTGYGKSTTINKLIGEDLFATDNFSSCTKDLYAAEYQLNKSNTQHFLSLGDLPGVGESAAADKIYFEAYCNFLRKANIVVYLLRADQRDFSIDLELFATLFSDQQEKNKVIIGLNFIDQIQPCNLPAKVAYISAIFDIEISRIACFSATENKDMEALAVKICERIKL